MWFIVAVYKEKKLLSEDAVEMESTETFGDLLFEILGYDIFDQPIVIQFYNELTKNWTNVKYGLSANLSLYEKFQPCQIKFTLKEQENLEKEDRQKVNGLCEIMEASRIPKLPKGRNFVICTGNEIIKALADLLWYVDLYHEKLKLRCCVIPEIFLSLSQYKIKSSYNLFYYAGKYKKEQLKREKLEDHLKAIEHFVSQPWAAISDLLQNSDFYELHLLDNYLSQDKDKSQETQMLILANEMITFYFTCQMRKNVTEKYSLIAKMAPSVWKLLYNVLAGDNSMPPHELSKEMQEKLRTILELQDADIVIDLRINNGFCDTKFDIFWNELREYFNEIIPAIHNRRSTSILYLPIAMSIADLKNIIIKKLEKKYGTPLNSEIYIPSNKYI
ncbi:hypothetical protein GLOIN_2v1482475 [Rhizophagus clarus]|uniref:Uncharacterized protein n=1 Tax=Rhizophagus clarus TaxID=94130 RepID=A0A8H3L9M5_9GLOM|nr:hypothetical protein GLOIN_2v1482475 [Rhizophagus clarus]